MKAEQCMGGKKAWYTKNKKSLISDAGIQKFLAEKAFTF